MDIVKIGLNLLHARPEIGGGWNYIANIVRAFALSDCDYEVVAYCTDASAEIVPDDPRFRIRKVRLGGSWQPARILYEQTILPGVAYRDKLDCMHWFAGNHAFLSSMPAVVTLYDCVFIEQPWEIPFAKRLYLSRMVKAACKRARVVVPMSESTAEAAIRLLGVAPERIVVVANPVDERYRPAALGDVQSFRRQFGLPPEFWLYVAHPYPHKNHARLFAAYKRLRETSGCSWPLVLRGGGCAKGDLADLERLACQLGVDRDIVWLPPLSLDDLVRLYGAAAAMVFPSLYEGCGIPLLEAMACGCPVVASNIPTTMEFTGEAAVVFDPESADEIYAAMRRFADDLGLREQCRAAGLARARNYSAESTARKLMEAYRQAVGSRRAKDVAEINPAMQGKTT